MYPLPSDDSQRHTVRLPLAGRKAPKVLLKCACKDRNALIIHDSWESFDYNHRNEILKECY